MMRKASVLMLLFFLAITKCYCQDLVPTDTDALLKVTVTNLDNEPSEGEIIIFTSKLSEKEYEGITNQQGKFTILVPKGETYTVKYRNFGYDHQYAEHEVPEYAGKLVSKINIKYQLPTKAVLEDVLFEFGKDELKEAAFKPLDKLVVLLQVKKNMKVLIGGHSDSAEKDMDLSRSRAAAVKKYLVEKGIDANRLVVKGYRDSMPMINGKTSEDKKMNRRIEVEII